MNYFYFFNSFDEFQLLCQTVKNNLFTTFFDMKLITFVLLSNLNDQRKRFKLANLDTMSNQTYIPLILYI